MTALTATRIPGVPGSTNIVQETLGEGSIDGQPQSQPEVDDDGEDSDPDGDQGNDGVEGGGYCGHHVGPDSSAVHYAHAHGQLLLEQRGHLWVEHDLEVTLHATSPNVQTQS